MDFLPSHDESTFRRPDFVPGTWVFLADGQAWNFAPPSAVPGYEQLTWEVVSIAVGSFMAYLNTGDPDRRLEAALGGHAGSLRVIAKDLGVYQLVFWAGSTLLKRNYRLTDADCDRLMPFNYQLAEIEDPSSKLRLATQPVLSMCNDVAAVLGMDASEEYSRAIASN